MKGSTSEQKTVVTHRIQLELNPREFSLFLRMLKYTHVIPQALANAESGSGWTLQDRVDLEGLLKEMKKTFSPQIFPKYDMIKFLDY